MTGSSFPALILCRQCYLRWFQTRPLNTWTKTSGRTVPLRIFATEDDVDSPYSKIKGENESPQDEKHQEKLKAQLAIASSDERLSNEFRNRVGRYRPRGLLEKADAINNQTGLILRSRIRIRPELDAFSASTVTPMDLIQTQENIETKECIRAAIESCINVAIDRLELRPSQENTHSHPKNRITIPHDQYTWLCSILEYQFSKSQLVDYGYWSGLAKSHLQKAKTIDTVRMILGRIWNLDKELELPPNEALVTKSQFHLYIQTKVLDIAITPRERFFMIGEGKDMCVFQS
jgi:hypothetical protein